MGLSSSLLLISVFVAGAAVAIVGLRVPSRLRDLEKLFVAAIVVLVVGSVAAHLAYGLDFFGIAHLLYLLGVVTVPLILGAWAVFARMQRKRRLSNLFGAIAAVIALTGVYATHIEPQWLQVDHQQLEAAIAAPLRFGVVADLQTPNVDKHERSAIAALLAEKPDVVMIPGDWYQGRIDELEANRADFVELLRQLVANTALVVVTSGDSDHVMPLEPIVQEAGAVFIDDRVITVEVRGVPLRIAGVRVVANGPDRLSTLAALAEPSDAFTVLVAHRPDAVYDLPPNADVDLVVSGHTHGGQISLPFFGPPVTFTEVPRELAAGGLGEVNGVPLYISSGVGLERLDAPQIRFGVRPEVGLIEVNPLAG